MLTGNCLDVLKTIPDGSVQCCVTSPPYYGLRDYGTAKWEGGNSECDHKGKPMATHAGFNERYFGKPSVVDKQGECLEFYKDVCGKCGAKRVDDQIGLEQTPDEYVSKLVQVFREVKRVLKDNGTLWLNLGDSYASLGQTAQTDEATGWKHGTLENEKRSRARGAGNGIKPKDLIGIPWAVAKALRSPWRKCLTCGTEAHDMDWGKIRKNGQNYFVCPNCMGVRLHAISEQGWYLRSDIIWAKPNPMPESVKDRPTKSHEYIFLLTKSKKYYYDYEAVLEPASGYDGRKDTKFKGSIKNYDGVMPGGKPQSFAQNGHERWQYKNLQEDGQKPNTMHENRVNGEEYMSPVRNKRDVWFVSTKPYREAHFATFPEDLIKPCILAGANVDDTVLDPFNGAGTTGVVCAKNGRKYIGIDNNPVYIELSQQRIEKVTT